MHAYFKALYCTAIGLIFTFADYYLVVVLSA